jgi:hypothetical protein
MNPHIHTARTLGDDALLARVKSLADHARSATAELIAHLVEVQRRKLHLASGYSSMFTYCCGALRLSEGETFNRIRAARAARRFPVILDVLAEGAVNLTTVKLLAPHLTDDNHLEVLQSARGLSRREVEKIVARLAPAPDAPTSVRKLPPRRPVPGPAAPVAPGATAHIFAAAPTPMPMPAEARLAAVSALSPERYKLQVTISGETLEKLDRAKEMLRHGRRGPDRRSGADAAPRRSGQEEIRRHRPTTAGAARGGPGGRGDSGSQGLRAGQAHRLDARHAAVHLRGQGRPKVPRTRAPRVPPCGPLRQGRPGDGAEHRPPVPATQPL